MSDANLRIKELGNGLKSEAIAADIHLSYNPATGSCDVGFSYADYVTDSTGTLVGNYAGADRTMIVVNFADLASRKFGTGLVDPLSQLRLDNVTGGGVFTILRAAADVLYNEHFRKPVESVALDHTEATFSAPE